MGTEKRSRLKGDKTADQDQKRRSAVEPLMMLVSFANESELLPSCLSHLRVSAI